MKSAKQFAAAALALPLLALSVMAAAAAPFTVAVTGLDDKPVAGARLIVTTFSDWKSVDFTTDEKGRFAGNLETAPRYEKNIGRVVIAAPGFGISGGALKVGDNVFHLEPARRIEGAVKDAAGKPVEGAKVRLSRVSGDQGFQSPVFAYLSGETDSKNALQREYSAQSDAQGHWQINGLPESGTASVALEDERFVRAAAQVDLKSSVPAPPLVARPAAFFTGRVVYEGGNAAANIEVAAQGQSAQDGWSSAKTDANGVFKLSSLPSGSFNVSVTEASGQWVAAAKEGAVAREGESVALGDLVLTHGVLVIGKVVDEQSGAPLQGAQVGAYGPQHPRSSAQVSSADTDARGEYSLRVAPGENYLYVMGLPAGYVRPRQEEAGNVTLTLQSGEKKTADFRLPKALTLSGIAVDEKGDPVANVQLTLGDSWEGHAANSDARGAWKIEGLSGTETRLSAAGDWEVVQPKTVVWTDAPPLRVVLRRITLAQVQGRVVTPRGEPIPGAQLRLNVSVTYADGRGTSRPVQLQSDAAGRFALPDMRPEEKITLRAAKENYAFVSGGAIGERANGKIQVSDIVLAPLEARAAGRVLAADGKPLEGALVFSPAATKPPVRSGADGTFVLENLAAGDIELMAARGTDFGRVLANAQIENAPAAVIEVMPQTPLKSSDIARGAAILRDLKERSAGTDYYAKDSLDYTLLDYSPSAYLKRNGKALETLDDNFLASIIAQFAAADPQAALPLIPRLEKIATPENRARSAASLGLALADAQPEIANQLYRAARAALQTQNGKMPAMSSQPGSVLLAHLATAALAERLKKPEAAQQMEWAFTIAEQLGNGARVMALTDVANEIGPLYPPLLRRLYDEIGRLPEPATRPEIGNESPAYGRAVIAPLLIEAIGENDPQGALAIARGVRSSSNGQSANALALAATFQKGEAAAPVFREAMEATAADYRAVIAQSKIAALAYSKNPALGQQLFEEVEGRLQNRDDRGSEYSQGDDVAAFAFYFARVDAAQSRALIESAWAGSKQNRGGERNWGSSNLVTAMAAVDVERALQMASELNNLNARFDVQRKIAQYVLASDEVRRMLPFDRWNASDTWSPGTPTGW